MSHFSKVSHANIVNPDAFIAACAELGFTTVLRNVAIQDYYGQSQTVDVAVQFGRKYQVAIKRNEQGNYDLVADFWGIRVTNPNLPQTDKELQDLIVKLTTKHTIIDQYQSQGFHADVTEDENQNLTVTLSR